MAIKHFLAGFPPPEEISKKLSDNNLPRYREINGHIHTPFSFSAFREMNDIFSKAKDEKVAVLGINDFFVTDGYDSFYQASLKNRIFPLFNIEFIGLLKDEQKKGIRINDPNNPGRIYFSGKGLDYPFNPGIFNKLRLKTIVRESQYQMKAMISKLNNLISPANPGIVLSYEEIKRMYARKLVRERHLAMAVRFESEKCYPEPEARILFLEKIYGGKKSNAGANNSANLENEIRANLLKSGGAAFVEENGNAFLELNKIIKIILRSGGIPCYPVLLDDPTGKFTEFESDREKLYNKLTAMKTGCIELIPARNSLKVLREFVKYFHERDYLVIFGTEHNTPEMMPLTVTARGSEQIDEGLKQIVWESVCVIAAHQYLRAQGMQGYILPDGSPSIDQKKELAFLGRLVIEYFLSNH